MLVTGRGPRGHHRRRRAGMGGDGAGARDAEGGAGPVERTVSLGPGLGQCCGGAVTLGSNLPRRWNRPQGAPLWVWGAGHVGRALVDTLGPLPDVALSWIDTSPGALPATIPRPSRALSLPIRRA
jgi:xanthine dehydrogenase accessory factor